MFRLDNFGVLNGVLGVWDGSVGVWDGICGVWSIVIVFRTGILVYIILVRDIIFGMAHLVLKGYVWYSEKCIYVGCNGLP